MYCIKGKRSTLGDVVGIAYPSTLPQAVKAELVCDLRGVHGVLHDRQFRKSQSSSGATHRQILLVGKDQEKGIPKLILVQHPLELLTSLADTLPIVGIDNEDDSLGVLEVVAPERADLVLTTDIPHSEGNVLVLNGLDVEAWSRS